MWTTDTTQRCVTDFSDHWHRRCADRPIDLGTFGVVTPRSVVTRIRRTRDLDERDLLVLDLVRLARAGHDGAEQILLLLVLPRVVHLTRTCRGLRVLPVRDAQAIAFGAVWEAIRELPDAATTAVLHRIGLDALRIITRTATAAVDVPETPVDDEALARLVEGGSGRAPVDDALRDLATVLRWAIDEGVMTSDEVRELAVVDLGEPDDRERLARELGIAPASLTRRVHRLRVRLREAVRAEIVRAGTW
ncbi:hypothetical protein HNR16_002772 [Pseudoclavibacter chungangensis]|uniref:hypothetical protein n=1 Tax=Pseudoclavibacter chungangensis TaxID=587635 RepID=UPI0015CC03FB|nr:hypothetical protein [Pseudoclavibacter chungangensis]NYJ67984.1 hypothetical protein [Pseudoclavibacter chungangensis]